MTKADKFVSHMIKAIQRDGRLAYLIGPMSEGYELMTDAFSELKAMDVDSFRKEYEKTLKPERVSICH